MIIFLLLGRHSPPDGIPGRSPTTCKLSGKSKCVFVTPLEIIMLFEVGSASPYGEVGGLRWSSHPVVEMGSWLYLGLGKERRQI